MLKRLGIVVAACALALPALFADDAFVGTWKYNKDKSDEKGQVWGIADLGSNKYKMIFGTLSFDLMADGTDQTTLPGATTALTILDANKWQMVNKVNEKTQGTSIWTLSPDGKSMSGEYKGTQPDGSAAETHTTATRVSGSGGFTGTWMVADTTSTDPGPLVIEAHDRSGLTLSNPVNKSKLDLTMNGKDCAAEGPTVLPGTTTSAKRHGPQSITMTDKQNGKVLDTEEWKVAADGKTLIITHHDAGVEKVLTWVYEKQQAR